MLDFLVPYSVRDDFLPEAVLAELAEQVRQCPYLAASDLNEGFTESLGFTVLFQPQQRGRLLKLLPALEGYLDRVLRKDCQAYFLNPLVVFQGRGIAPHADKTLLSFLPKAPFPRRVSVLYLQVPEGVEGGHLVLHRNAFARSRVVPRSNRLVEFAGWLSHEVTAWRGQQARISLVCEQYQLSSKWLSQIPDFHVESTAEFEQFLDRAVQEKASDL